MGKMSEEERDKLLQEYERERSVSREVTKHGAADITPHVLALIAGIAAWWGVRYWIVATFGFGQALAAPDEISSLVERAAVGIGVAVWLAVAAIVSATRHPSR